MYLISPPGTHFTDEKTEAQRGEVPTSVSSFGDKIHILGWQPLKLMAGAPSRNQKVTRPLRSDALESADGTPSGSGAPQGNSRARKVQASLMTQITFDTRRWAEARSISGRFHLAS